MVIPGYTSPPPSRRPNGHRKRSVGPPACRLQETRRPYRGNLSYSNNSPGLLLERALETELTEHLGHTKHAPRLTQGGNARNGKSAKTVKGEFGKLPIEVPRNRNATFEPMIIPKGQTRFTSV
ncbi:MAG: hypothetical protein EYX74_04965 [Desulfobulbaceae bacterium]|nr:MAG: hypothetical protein EYX74_04965 [Desulfobulbaceae bacterium]